MARPGITEQDVFETIVSLQETGTKITVENIRIHLRRGSPNTINRHLRCWREKSAIDIKQLKNQCTALKRIMKRLDAIDLKLDCLINKAGIEL
jgi:hypothetical protein